MTTKKANSQKAATRALFVEKWPDIFAPKGQSKRPLKIGIHKDIQAAMPDFPSSHISAAVYDYTNGPTYLQNLKAGTERVGLDGKPTGVVTLAEQREAEGRLRWFKAAVERHSRERELRDLGVTLVTILSSVRTVLDEGYDDFRGPIDNAIARADELGIRPLELPGRDLPQSLQALAADPDPASADALCLGG